MMKMKYYYSMVFVWCIILLFSIKLFAQNSPTDIPPEQRIIFNIEVGNSPVKGPQDAKVTIIEFSDFQCPFCKKGGATVKKIAEDYPNDVKLVFKHYPLQFHQNARIAAQASLLANEQGKFWEMHDKLFENQNALERKDLEKYAQEIGLDMEKFKTGLDNNAYNDAIEADMKVANELGITGTPAFFVNGRFVSGAKPYETFKSMVEQELAWIRDGNKPEFKLGKNVKEAMPQKKGPDPNKIYTFDNQGWPVRGNPDAKVTIVEFTDFQCPFCKKVEATLKKILEEYPNDVKIITKQHPLPFHNKAELAAEAALAAHDQGKYWEMHDKLFENQNALERADLEKYAQELGLDMEKFKQSLDNMSHKEMIKKASKESEDIGATGTPAFFINGRYLRGAQPFENFKKLIDEELSKLGITPPQGSVEVPPPPTPPSGEEPKAQPPKPEEKPTEVKPEEKPKTDKPEEPKAQPPKPEEKPTEVKPEEKPKTDKPEVKPEEKTKTDKAKEIKQKKVKQMSTNFKRESMYIFIGLLALMFVILLNQLF